MFCNAGAPLRTKTDPSKVKAYGPGIEPKGNHSMAITKFTVETFAAGAGKVSCVITNPAGKQEPVSRRLITDHSFSRT